jgi:ankyrin repeat protein
LLLEYGADANGPDEDGLPPLLFLLGRGHCDLEILSLLLEHGTDPNLGDGWDIPLDKALDAVFDHKAPVQIIEKLLESGANINARTLCNASHRDKSGTIVSMLLDKGAKVNAQDLDGDTALMCAARNGRPETIRILLDRGADANLTNWEGDRAIDLAHESLGGTEVFHRLEEASKTVDGMQTVPSDKDFLIMLAASRHATDEEILAAIEAGANVAAREDFRTERRTALMRAAESRGISVIEKLIAKGAELNTRDNEGDTALMIAVSARNNGVVLPLLKNGAKIDIKNNEGNTALMIAVKAQNNEIVLPLLESGAKIDARNKKGNTALMTAIREQNEEIIPTLLENGAAINAKNGEGNTVLMLAAHGGYCSTEMFSYLIERGANIDAVNRYNETALLLLINNRADRSSKEVFEKAIVLIQKGGNVNAQCNKGLTVLMMAVNKLESPFDLDLTRILIEKGAQTSINKQDADGETALMLAARSYGSKTGELVALLFENGAELDVQSNEGWYALMFAADAGNRDVYEMLLKYGADDKLMDEDGATAFDRAEWNEHRLGCVTYR